MRVGIALPVSVRYSQCMTYMEPTAAYRAAVANALTGKGYRLPDLARLMAPMDSIWFFETQGKSAEETASTLVKWALYN